MGDGLYSHHRALSLLITELCLFLSGGSVSSYHRALPGGSPLLITELCLFLSQSSVSSYQAMSLLIRGLFSSYIWLLLTELRRVVERSADAADSTALSSLQDAAGELEENMGMEERVRKSEGGVVYCECGKRTSRDFRESVRHEVE